MANNKVSKNVARDKSIKLPKAVKKELAFTVEEQKEFLKEAKKERGYAAYKLDFNSGLRLGELLGLEWKHINFENCTVKVEQQVKRVKTPGGPSKTKLILTETLKTENSRRLVTIPSEVMKDLKKHKEKQDVEKIKLIIGNEKRKENLDNNGEKFTETLWDTTHSFVFPNQLGKMMDPRNFVRDYYTVLKRCKNIKNHYNFHIVRHSYATRLLEEGVNPKIVSELLGHADVETTLRIYSHVLQGIKQMAVECLNKYADNE